ncbi:MAG: methyl-accepting chemotaxis protein [Burkholderiaceae bacterium]
MSTTQKSAREMAPDVADTLGRIARSADLTMISTLAGSALLTVAAGWYFHQIMFALIGAAVILALGLFTFVVGLGRTYGWVVLTTCNVAMVALQIQIARGMIEFHFGVFVLLGLLLVFRDWRPVVLGAALFAVHHVLFDRLQAMGYGFYCLAMPNLYIVFLHAFYVVVQTSLEVFLAVGLRTSSVESAELRLLTRSIDQGESVCLDLEQYSVNSKAATSLQGAVKKMAAAMTDVQQAAASIESASVDIANGNGELSRRTEDQAGNLSQIAESMEQLVTLITQSAATSMEASQLAGQATMAANQGGHAVSAVVETMSGIAESSGKISEINEVIDGIAFQTNLLALNAAVEAARAGEHGRGFAIVATEVRTLAQRSADAAHEIRALIDDSTRKVSTGTEQVSSAGNSMDNIVKQAEAVSALVQELSEKAATQNAGVNEVGSAMSQLDSVTQSNNALVIQSAAASEQLQSQATRLNAVVGQFVLARS